MLAQHPRRDGNKDIDSLTLKDTLLLRIITHDLLCSSPQRKHRASGLEPRPCIINIQFYGTRKFCSIRAVVRKEITMLERSHTASTFTLVRRGKDTSTNAACFTQSLLLKSCCEFRRLAQPRSTIRIQVMFRVLALEIRKDQQS